MSMQVAIMREQNWTYKSIIFQGLHIGQRYTPKLTENKFKISLKSLFGASSFAVGAFMEIAVASPLAGTAGSR